MSLAQIRDEFHVPARLGARVLRKGIHEDWAIPATVVGSDEDLIIVEFDRTGNRTTVRPADLVFLKS